MISEEMFVVKVVFSGSILDVYFNRLKNNVMAWMYGIPEREGIENDSRVWGLSNQRMN